MIGAFLATFGLVFIAEVGDKSMLLVMTLATRYRPWWVFIAVSTESAVVMALAVSVGAAAGALLPERALEIAAGLAFLGFGVWALRDSAAEEEVVEAGGARTAFAVIAVLAVTLFVAELGDKTQIATLSLASVHPGKGVAVWAGATLGMVVGDGLAILLGHRLTRLLSPHVVGRLAGAIFVLTGLVTLTLAWSGVG